jgi:hypothetical protein
VSEIDDDLEMRALERQLDDAFQTTRPRADFEDELWLKVQASRPAPTRLRDAFAGFWQGVREVPAVPAAAVALLMVIVVTIGTIGLKGGLHGGGGAGGASTSSSTQLSAGPAAGQYIAGTFGRIPSPAFNNGPKTAAPPASAPGGADYAGPVQMTWTGALDVRLSTVPVFRYREPGIDQADQFASGLGAVLRERSSGFLGTYSASDYTLKVRGTVQSPAATPAYFIFSSLTMPAVDAAGASPQDISDIFLAQHSLQPQWNHTVSVDSSSDPVKVRYERQFDVPSYGPAYFVDFNNNRAGLEVDLSSNRPVVVSGMLPTTLEIANYNAITVGEAVRSVTSFTAPPAQASASASPPPTVQLNQLELVYVLVPAGDHSFFEPAFMFSGKFQAGGQSYTKRVLVAAVDPSQRT